jgi:membrane protein required for colicin V production
MNIFDVIILIITSISLIIGIKKGFIMAIATLVASILGIIGAVLFSGIVAGWLSENKTFGNYVPIISFLILFVGIIIAVLLLAKLIDTLIKTVHLGWLNRIGGGIFLVFKTMFLVSIFILIIDFFGFGTKIISYEKREKSFLFAPIERFAPATFNLFKIKYEHLMPKNNQQETVYYV